MSGPRYIARAFVDRRELVVAHAVVDAASGEPLAYFAHPGGAYVLAGLLDALAGGAWPEDVLLGDGAHRHFLRRLDLRHDAVCWHCGHAMPAGTPAYWHPISRAVRHVGSCRRAHLRSAVQAKRDRVNARRRQRRQQEQAG